MRGRSSMLLAAALALAASTPGLPVLPINRTRDEDDPLRVPGREPDNLGRRAEKDAIALAKAQAKRERKAAKRAAQKVSAGDTANKRPNV